MIGIDEVGRGAWAGPLLVVAASQITLIDFPVNDSKKLTKKQREAIFEKLRQICKFGEGWVEADEIDKLGLTKAMRLGVARALKALGAKETEEIIMDGHINYCEPKFVNVECVIKADAKYPVVSAASIYAKVTRDNYMAKLSEKHQEYNFANNVGYGTAGHRQAINDFGVTKYHRLSYKPVKESLN
ncbi:ribonuclease HII [Candidatus Saccharibacteria bacterium]|nr:ribonuclease HII [Candidatus Saccharibacteria bacterium]